MKSCPSCLCRRPLPLRPLIALGCTFLCTLGALLPLPLLHSKAEAADASENTGIPTSRSFPPGTPASEQAAAYTDLSEQWAGQVDELADALTTAKKGQQADKLKVKAASAATNAIAAAQRATTLAPESARAHVALAVAYGKRTDYVDNSTKMSLSRQIRDEAERALALNPNEELAHHIMGRWNYGFATINPVLKLAARVVYGTLPAASLETAQRHLEQAAALNPRRLATHQYLALIYEATGTKEKAAQHWKIVLELPAGDAEERAAQKEARKALK